jgi:patatin-like phospholipase/acyl hydrolase
VARFQILTFDGGGVRGSFALGVIVELEIVLGHSITECFDMLAGTSTGAIAAAGLSLGLSGEDLIRFYREHIAMIFQSREPYRAKGWTRPIFPLVGISYFMIMRGFATV